MKQSQKERILEMLEKAPDNTVTCWQLAQEFLYHKASTRIGEIETEKGLTIEFIKGKNPMDGKYRLIKKGGDVLNENSINSQQDSTLFETNKSEPVLEPVRSTIFDEVGQGKFI